MNDDNNKYPTQTKTKTRNEMNEKKTTNNNNINENRIKTEEIMTHIDHKLLAYHITNELNGTLLQDKISKNKKPMPPNSGVYILLSICLLFLILSIFKPTSKYYSNNMTNYYD